MRNVIENNREKFDRVAEICRSTLPVVEQYDSTDNVGMRLLGYAYLYVYYKLFDDLEFPYDEVEDIESFLKTAASISAVVYKDLRDSVLVEDEGLFALTGSFLALYREYLGDNNLNS